MKRLTLVLLGIALFAAVAAGQRPRSTEFRSYPAAVEKTTARSIDFKRSPGASTYRTRLRNALKEGVNFAGRYILTGWGCGTGCSHSAVIDARTGRVYFPDELMGVSVWFGENDYDNETYKFRKNSRLLIIHGTPGPDIENAPQRKQGTYYYEWRANRLRLIKFVPDKSTPNA